MTSGVSIVVPTYRERENLPELIQQIDLLRAQLNPLELIIVDDDSADGTAEYLNNLNQTWIKPISRKHKRGLSSAVIDGFIEAQYPILVCMDGDLSHPIATIATMVTTIQQHAVDFVIGSRFVVGGNVDTQWSTLRHLNAAFAKYLAKPFTKIKDPMSGFFCLRKDTFTASDPLNPIGYKIGLELMVKCRCKNIIEIPIHFAQRNKGHSKLNLKERINYLTHLLRLLKYKYGR